MKKNFIVLLFLLLGLFFITSQASAAPVDMVVLLDTSESVLPIYNELVDYIIKDILSDYLKYGDTLHLISFDSTPSFIFSKQVNNRNDIEYVLKYIFSLYPLGKYTDIVSALGYLKNYVSDISNNSRHEIVILTDGIHSPPPGSPYQTIIQQETGVNLLEKDIQELKNANWKVNIIRLPRQDKTDAAGSGSSNSASNASGKGANSAVSDNYGKTGTAVPDSKKSGDADNESNIFNYIDNSKISTGNFNDSTGKNDSSSKSTAVNKNSVLDNITKSNNNVLIMIIIIIILLIIIIFILVSRYYSGVTVKESYNVVRNDIDIKGIDKEGSDSDNINRRPIIMKVDNQNDQVVGTSRNIHSFKTGTVKSIGGGNSSYLIFLYKIPGIIASLKFDGKKYIFTPLRPEFFPVTGDKEIENPLNKEIKIKTEKHHLLSIRFREYISPLEKINLIMKLTEHRGIPSVSQKEDQVSN